MSDTGRSAPPRITSVMLAQTVIQNAMTGNTSFIEIFNEIRLLQFPAAIAFHVVTLYDEFNQGGFEHHVRVLSPDGFTWETRMVVPSQPLPFLFIAAGPVAPLFSKEGELTVTILVDGKEGFVRRYPVQTILSAQAPAASVEGNP